MPNVLVSSIWDGNQDANAAGSHGCWCRCLCCPLLVVLVLVPVVGLVGMLMMVPGHGLVATMTYTPGGGGGGSEAKKKVVPKIDLQIRAPLMNFIFFLRKIFLMWVGGWVRRRSPGCHAAPPPRVRKGKP